MTGSRNMNSNSTQTRKDHQTRSCNMNGNGTGARHRNHSNISEVIKRSQLCASDRSNSNHRSNQKMLMVSAKTRDGDPGA